MARDTMNPQGLTFAEWVCAAGLAVVDGHTGLVRPYTSSYTRYPDHEPSYYLESPGRCYHDLRKPRRNKTTFYSTKIRQAWKNGEDPTDHRRGP